MYGGYASIYNLQRAKPSAPSFTLRKILFIFCLFFLSLFLLFSLFLFLKKRKRRKTNAKRDNKIYETQQTTRNILACPVSLLLRQCFRDHLFIFSNNIFVVFYISLAFSWWSSFCCSPSCPSFSNRTGALSKLWAQRSVLQAPLFKSQCNLLLLLLLLRLLECLALCFANGHASSNNAPRIACHA